MAQGEMPTVQLHGMYRDILRRSDGSTIWRRDWTPNTIVTDCRRLLAGFMRGAPTAAGIQGLHVGIGLPAWDQETEPTPPSSSQAALVDPFPHLIPQSALQIDFMEGDTISGQPTNRLQIVATLGPGVPAWPDVNHPAGTLREFGLVGEFDGGTVLLNYVTHLAIQKDAASTLERTIWLVF